MIDYDRQILEILMLVGEKGISVRMLSMHIYNMNCSLFNLPDVNEIHQYVQQYLLRNSKLPNSIIERTERRGFYRLNTSHSEQARQLMLNFEGNENGIISNERESEIIENNDICLDLFS